MISPFSAVLFDVDGVLVDACEIHYEALNQALAEFGYTITRAEHEAIYNGRPTKKKLQILTDQKGLSPALHEEIARRKQEYTVARFSTDLSDSPEKRDLLRLIHEAGMKVGVCSNSLRTSIEIMLHQTGVLDEVDIFVGNDEVAQPKPSPEIYLEGARRLKLDIEQCVIVEDSLVGLRSAIAAAPGRVLAVKGPETVNASLMEHIVTCPHIKRLKETL